MHSKMITSHLENISIKYCVESNSLRYEGQKGYKSQKSGDKMQNVRRQNRFFYLNSFQSSDIHIFLPISPRFFLFIYWAELVIYDDRIFVWICYRKYQWWSVIHHIFNLSGFFLEFFYHSYWYKTLINFYIFQFLESKMNRDEHTSGVTFIAVAVNAKSHSTRMQIRILNYMNNECLEQVNFGNVSDICWFFQYDEQWAYVLVCFEHFFLVTLMFINWMRWLHKQIVIWKFKQQTYQNISHKRWSL